MYLRQHQLPDYSTVSPPLKRPALPAFVLRAGLSTAPRFN